MRSCFPNTTRCRSTPGEMANCCLPKGATEATLLGTFDQPAARAMFSSSRKWWDRRREIRRMPTFAIVAPCASPQVTTQDAHGQPLVDPLFEDGTGAPITSAAQKPTPVTEIQWSADDALPFPVCLSSKFLDSKGKEQTLTERQRGLRQRRSGRSRPVRCQASTLGPFRAHESSIRPIQPRTAATPRRAVPVPVRYRPLIPDSPITQAVSLQLAGSPVTAAIVHLLTNSFVTLDGRQRLNLSHRSSRRPG